MSIPQPNQYGAPPMGPYPIQQQAPFQMNTYPPQQFDYPQQPNYNFGQPTAPPPYGQEPHYYPPQQVIMQQPTMNQPQTVHIIQQGAVGAHPQVLQCPNCHEIVTSNVESSATSSTHMSACLLGIIGWYCCCCLIPYCMDSCKSQTHRCPRCNTYLGKFDESAKNSCLGTGALAACCLLCDGDGCCCGD